MQTADLSNDAVSGGVNVSGSTNVVGGDFVGRDNDIFRGRDVVGSGGDVTGRDKYVINVQGAVSGDIVIYPNTPLGRIGTQIERLRGRVTRLMPAEESIKYLIALREPTTISNRVGSDFKVSVPLPLVGEVSGRVYVDPAKKVESQEATSANVYLDELSDIEANLSPETEPQKMSGLLQRLSLITDEVNVRIARLNSEFVRLVYPALSSRELIDNMVLKIGHRELREEAKMHSGVTSQLVKRLNAEQLTKADNDVLDDATQAAVGVMTELEKRRLLVENLVRSDRRRRNWTVSVVISYIGVIIAASIYLIITLGGQAILGQVPLSQLRLPLLGIPWPVIVWSLLGSFAAMIYRFNKRPIYDFGDAVKWMLTRPFQGVVLGSAFYLVLTSGLFLLTGNTANGSSLPNTTDEVILVLSFLVGFSDRFADSVFNTLVERYSKSASPQKGDTDESTQKIEQT